MKNRTKIIILLLGLILLGLFVIFFLSAMGVPLFIIIFLFFMELQVFTIFKPFRVIWMLTPVIEIVLSIFVAVFVLPQKSYDGGLLIFNLLWAAFLQCIVLVFLLIMDIKRKEPGASLQTFKMKTVLTELCTCCEKRINKLIRNKRDKVSKILLVGDSYTGELRLKCLGKDGRYELDTYIKPQGQLKIFLDTYYYYSVGDKRNVRMRIMNDIEKDYEKVWMELLKNCEKRMRKYSKIEFEMKVE